MILLAALLCNYGRGKCLIIIGTEGGVNLAHPSRSRFVTLFDTDSTNHQNPRLLGMPRTVKGDVGTSIHGRRWITSELHTSDVLGLLAAHRGRKEAVNLVMSSSSANRANFGVHL